MKSTKIERTDREQLLFVFVFVIRIHLLEWNVKDAFPTM